MPESLFNKVSDPLPEILNVKVKTASWISFNEFSKIFILRTHFLQYSSGRLFLILKKLGIQTFNSKQFLSLNQYY